MFNPEKISELVGFLVEIKSDEYNDLRGAIQSFDTELGSLILYTGFDSHTKLMSLMVVQLSSIKSIEIISTQIRLRLPINEQSFSTSVTKAEIPHTTRSIDEAKKIFKSFCVSSHDRITNAFKKRNIKYKLEKEQIVIGPLRIFPPYGKDDVICRNPVVKKSLMNVLKEDNVFDS